jgi:hypothetical protein
LNFACHEPEFRPEKRSSGLLDAGIQAFWRNILATSAMFFGVLAPFMPILHGTSVNFQPAKPDPEPA